MGTRQHRLRCMLMSETAELTRNLRITRCEHLLTVANHQGMREVVNVLAGATKMNELAHGDQFHALFDGVFQKVFDGFDIVVCRCLDGLDLRCLRLSELLSDAIQYLGSALAECRHFGNCVTL